MFIVRRTKLSSQLPAMPAAALCAGQSGQWAKLDQGFSRGSDRSQITGDLISRQTGIRLFWKGS